MVCFYYTKSPPKTWSIGDEKKRMVILCFPLCVRRSTNCKQTCFPWRAPVFSWASHDPQVLGPQHGFLSLPSTNPCHGGVSWSVQWMRILSAHWTYSLLHPHPSTCSGQSLYKKQCAHFSKSCAYLTCDFNQLLDRLSSFSLSAGHVTCSQCWHHYCVTSQSQAQTNHPHPTSFSLFLSLSVIFIYTY